LLACRLSRQLSLYGFWWPNKRMYKRLTRENLNNSARIRGLIDDLLRGYFQACTNRELPLRLREALNKLYEERPAISSEQLHSERK
jgi:hypothetical protein